MINELQLCADDSKFGCDFAFSCDGFQSVTEVEANGVGSLLAMMQGSGSDYIGYYFADGNGNINCMYGTNDQELASYRYNSFGNITNATGSWAGQNRYQWSSKENDAAMGLVYYLYWFYSPELGRWVNRDPIEEEGGLNLYGMVGNDAVNWLDPLGLHVDMNLFNKKESIHDFANKVPKSEKDNYKVGGHGNPQTVVDSNGKPISPKELAGKIKADTNYKPGTPVDLKSCNTGKGKNSYAKQLAKELKAPVNVPNNYVWYYPDGKTVVAPAKGGDFKNGPDLNKPGKMVRYKP